MILLLYTITLSLQEKVDELEDSTNLKGQSTDKLQNVEELDVDKTKKAHENIELPVIEPQSKKTQVI